MDYTKVMAEFNILGDSFPVEDITLKLSIIPTESYNKGDLSKYNNIKKETCWCISTGYEESMDINDQLSKIIGEIRDKKDILIQLKNQYNLEFQLMIVLNIIDNDKPAIYLDKDIIHFVSDIDASIQFDYYIYS